MPDSLANVSKVIPTLWNDVLDVPIDHTNVIFDRDTETIDRTETGISNASEVAKAEGKAEVTEKIEIGR